ncbi:MAG: hypothetical protein COW03_06955 [Cytophagales bacterium CG12_big_fil_rev_8_21_14_0_65_40_12]|nr:MAG: hypothetical protein COW03_06955 [Cytophagales bacterium CG12_big_fil_rev_8_21_14_0_65_40_12]PIW02853.1 MAG: hypothetical protein COW40_17875 [Cytophagales bacterium CG17_big_fil_post_rev_8_21_14_2_50_40_13]
MKKSLTFIFAIAFLAITQNALAQRGPAASPLATVKQVVGNTEVEIIYSRPSLAGRSANDLVNNLNNGVWRTGANTNTILAFNKDVTLGGQALKAGRYSLWSIPANGEWTIIINSLTDKWGTAYDKSGDVIKFKAPVTKTSNAVETFEINVTDFNNKTKDSANIELAWGDFSVKFPLKVTN